LRIEIISGCIKYIPKDRAERLLKNSVAGREKEKAIAITAEETINCHVEFDHPSNINPAITRLNIINGSKSCFLPVVIKPRQAAGKTDNH